MLSCLALVSSLLLEQMVSEPTKRKDFIDSQELRIVRKM